MSINPRFFFYALSLLGWLSAAPAFALAPVQEIKTDAGVSAWLVEDHSLPLITVKIAFREAGTTSDPVGKEGRARLAVHLLDEGAGKMDALAFATARDDRAIRWDIDVKGDFSTVTIQTLREHREEALKLLGTALSAPRFDAEAIARVRSQMLIGLKRAAEDPDAIAAKAWQKTIFGTHPYGRDAEGTEAGLSAVTLADLQTYAKTRLTQGNALVGVVGDVTAAEAKTLLENALKALPKGETLTPVTEATIASKASEKAIPRDIPQTVVRFGGPGLKRTDADYMTGFVVNEIVGGGGLTSRLSEEIREKRGLAYASGTDLAPMLHAGVLQGSFATRSGKAGEAVKVMRETLGQLRDKGVTAQELQDAKNYLTGEFPMRLDSQGELAGYLINMQLFDLGRDYLEKRNALIEAVTLENANRVAKNIYDPSRFTLVTVGKEESAPK